MAEGRHRDGYPMAISRVHALAARGARDERTRKRPSLPTPSVSDIERLSFAKRRYTRADTRTNIAWLHPGERDSAHAYSSTCTCTAISVNPSASATSPSPLSASKNRQRIEPGPTKERFIQSPTCEPFKVQRSTTAQPTPSSDTPLFRGRSGERSKDCTCPRHAIRDQKRRLQLHRTISKALGRWRYRPSYDRVGHTQSGRQEPGQTITTQCHRKHQELQARIWRIRATGYNCAAFAAYPCSSLSWLTRATLASWLSSPLATLDITQ